MALNKEYFDSINIDIVRKKYYNANKVESLLKDIRVQAEAMTEENTQLKAQLEELNRQKTEISEAVLSAQAMYKTTIARAKQQAEEILSEANAKRAAIIQEASKQQEFAISHVGECYRKVKEEYETCIEDLNSNWQGYLSGIVTEGDIPVSDIGARVGDIAQKMFSLNEDDDSEDSEDFKDCEDCDK